MQEIAALIPACTTATVTISVRRFNSGLVKGAEVGEKKEKVITLTNEDQYNLKLTVQFVAARVVGDS